MKCYQKIGYLFIRLLLSVCFCLLILSLDGCTLASDGWYSRMENKAEMSLFALNKIDENTRALVKNTGNETVINEWKNNLKNVRKPQDAPNDKNSGDWIETLLYILLGASGLGGVAKGANFLYKIKPPTNKLS